MKQPDFTRAAESLYSFDKNDCIENVSKPTDFSNLSGRPSLIPGVEYPLSEKEEQLLDKAWQHFCNMKLRGVL